MAKIAFFELEHWEKTYMQRKLKGHEVQIIDGPANSQNISGAKDAQILCVFIYSKIGRAELEQLPNLKMIATRSTGFDHIDVNACAEKGIVVCNVPSYGSETVAEHSVMLMMAIAKKLIPSIERSRKGDFSLEGLRTFDLEGKKLGIVGAGKIGQHVIKICRSFGMKALVFDPFADEAMLKKLHAKKVEFDELLRKSDVISLHAPLTKENHHLINLDAVSKMKKGVILINTARGGLVDAQALIAGLDAGTISGAGLDVVEEECGIKEERQLLSPDFAGECDLRTVLANHILLNKENVLITPHNAFNSIEALHRILDTTLENIKGFEEGNPANLVKKR